LFKGRHVALALLIAATTACGPHGIAPVTATEFTLQQAADSVPLAYRKDVKVGEVWMTFTGVSSDSRCPRGVKCVWEGDAVVELAVHPGCFKQGCKAASQLLSLHTTLEPKSGSGWGYRVTLLSLAPHPVHGTPTDSSQYVAWVRVTP
jgi:hypothetical protein